ncbi:carbamate kinase [Aeromonas cavernicola]|uniref:Carbamate kinase n=1 Tax=Aeromonas cavernicola TaxID=1006623 RepID=A0A2H9U9D9_9GAMM|nr:carbamate kinase [Aeromonas cavernicola]PJG60660.1 carbamate kinase [Aeromonas cavernicola]
MQQKKLAVVAVGGNALIRANDQVGLDQQYDAVAETARHVAELIAAGWRVVLTHGNGPQVGFILRRSELASGEVPTVPLEYAVGDTQGAIGFMFQNALGNELHRRGLQDTKVVAMVTQTLIDRHDPAFSHPDKPIGAHMDQALAERLAAQQGWQIAEDAGRGWRRVVASPAPLGIVETPTIKALLDQEVLVIACGGGGIPVVREADGTLQAAQAVIDKDRASALLATQLQADMLLIPTGVERVAIHFGTPQQRWLDTLSLAEATQLQADGHFGAGSMGPKVEAMLSYLAGCPDGVGLITNPESMGKAVSGQAGTRFLGR